MRKMHINHNTIENYQLIYKNVPECCAIDVQLYGYNIILHSLSYIYKYYMYMIIPIDTLHIIYLSAGVQTNYVLITKINTMEISFLHPSVKVQ